jgi:uncharacterized membrane protein
MFPTNLAGATFVICAGIVPGVETFVGTANFTAELFADVCFASAPKSVFSATTVTVY